MILWWNQTLIWQRYAILGIAVALFILGMQSWVWSPIDNTISQVTSEVASLAQENQEHTQKLEALKDVEQEVLRLRERLVSVLQPFPEGSAPQAFRKEVMDVGQRTGVSVRLWKPQYISVEEVRSRRAINIKVKVEGSFFNTVQFLEELLKFSWLRTVDPLVLVRKDDIGTSSLVITDFTIHGMEIPSLLQAMDM